MSKPLTPGEKARRANVRAMKAIGRANARAKAATAQTNLLAHVEAMNRRSEDAARVREERRAFGIEVRDAHNERLHLEALGRRVTKRIDGSAAAKATAYEVAANRPVGMGDGYGVPVNDVASVIVAA